jgi:hypothetical protein
MRDETEEQAGGPTADLPALIAAAGEPAVRAYREFLDDPVRTPGTRKNYAMYARRFFCWVESRGLTLATIDPPAIAAYKDEIARAKSWPVATLYLTPVRGVLGHLARAGVLPSNPCPRWITLGAATAAAGFPLLDLLAFLAHMEEESPRSIFDDESSALSLLERVRWPDGPICPHCATPTFADSPVEAACTACGRAFTVTTNTMFADSPVPVRHWFTLLHQMYVARAGLPDQELAERLGLSLAASLSAAGRIQDAMAHERLPAGEDLAHAIDRRNRELMQEDGVRSIIRYAELTAIRDRLHRARAEGGPVDDLPPGMTLDEAIARIAEEDRYVFTVEDDLLVRHRIESDPGAGEVHPSEMAGDRTDGPQQAPDAR